MARGAYVGFIAGALALMAVSSSWAQGEIPLGLRALFPYTGALLPNASYQPSIPSDWITPNSVYYYPVPQPIYVPVPVTPERPAVESVRVAMVTLSGSSGPADVRVRRDTVVSWMNGGDRDLTLLIDAASPTTASGATGRQSGVVRPGGTFSLAFHQPGVYNVSVQGRPERRARVIVEE
jgi:hypothetical protein